MVNFFIDRPIFAWVVAIVMMLAGLLAIKTLPISQYPPVAPPAISVDAFYPGASAKTVENTVTQIIEQKMTGLDRLLYMSATSDSAGHGSVTLTFQPGTDPDAAWAKVQNKLELAKPLMPQVVQQMGISVTKSTKNIFMILSITSTDGSMNAEDLRDYLASNVENVISRVEGVGEVMSFGTQYAMRIWLNPDRMVGYHITPDDIRQAVKAYNAQISAGQAGGLPAIKGQQLNVTVNVQELLQTPEQFGAIPLRTNPDGSTIRLRDVARTELGTESYESDTRLNGNPAAGMLIRLASGANALDTSNLIKAKLNELSPFFPAGVQVDYPYETTPFVSVAIAEVIKTLIEAVVLVFLVMLLFLGNFRATLIPTIAVPVVLLGTFAILQYVGMSINMLTMFAMVLAIGLLVDDAIVVVENVERIMHEEGLSPLEATRKSMGQITGALVGIGLVLSAVFGPMAFFGGSTGIIFRQFSFTLPPRIPARQPLTQDSHHSWYRSGEDVIRARMMTNPAPTWLTGSCPGKASTQVHPQSGSGFEPHPCWQPLEHTIEIMSSPPFIRGLSAPRHTCTRVTSCAGNPAPARHSVARHTGTSSRGCQFASLTCARGHTPKQQPPPFLEERTHGRGHEKAPVLSPVRRPADPLAGRPLFHFPDWRTRRAEQQYSDPAGKAPGIARACNEAALEGR